MGRPLSLGFTYSNRYGKHAISGFNALAVNIEVFKQTALKSNAAYTARNVGLAYMDLVRANIENGIETIGGSYPALSSNTVELKNRNRGARSKVEDSKKAEMPWMESGDFVENALGFFDEAGKEVPRKEVIRWLMKQRDGNVKIGYGVPLDSERENNPGADQIRNYSELAYILEYGAHWTSQRGNRIEIPARPVFSITVRSDKLREIVGKIRTHSLKALVDSWENVGRDKPNYFLENRVKKYFDAILKAEDKK